MDKRKSVPKVCYICGPISGIKDYNAEAFNKAEEILTRNCDMTCFNPWKMDLADGVDPKKATYRDVLPRDIAAIGKSDCVIVLPGWNDSKGAQFELMYARLLGLPVYSLEEFRAEYAQQGCDEEVQHGN